MNKKAWIIFAGVCIVLLAGLVYLSSKNRLDVSGTNSSEIQAASEQSGNIADHVFGKSDSKVVLVEYGDFQCPGCGQAHPTVKAISEKYEDQVAFVFRNFPLASIHPNARAAASAVEAAGLQDKYWEMHNKLFESQSSWSALSTSQRTDYFVDAAKELGLDAKKFNTDLVSDRVAQKISYDLALGKANGVSSTPTFRLNGTDIPQGIWSDMAKFEEIIDAELKKNNVEPPKVEN